MYYYPGMECFRAWYEPSSSSRCSGSRCQIMTSCHPIYEVSMELSLLSLNHDYWSSTATYLYYQLATSSDPRPEYCSVWLPAGLGAPGLGHNPDSRAKRTRNTCRCSGIFPGSFHCSVHVHDVLSNCHCIRYAQKPPKKNLTSFTTYSIILS